jgi:prepilin-type processing-associated H-X9-DG protein
MNAMLGNAGNFSAGGFNINNPGYKQFFKSTQIPRPSEIFAFLDEHPDSIDDGYFLNKAAVISYGPYSSAGYSRNEWTDLPASYHNNSAAFSFADGHAALHRWIDASTIRPSHPSGAALPRALNPDSRSDFDWVIQHMSIEN